MTESQFNSLEKKLITSIKYLAERTTDTAEAQGLAAVVQALVSLEMVRQSAQAAL